MTKEEPEKQWELLAGESWWLRCGSMQLSINTTDDNEEQKKKVAKVISDQLSAIKEMEVYVTMQ